MKPIVCGIDLGTTNSVIAFLQNGTPQVIAIEQESAILPSVVSFDQDKQSFLVGRSARNRRAAFPHLTVASVKRRMGTSTPISLGNSAFLPEDISSFIVKHLAEKASRTLGQPVRKAVITVPAYFDDLQRRATIRAGELAGLEVVRIVNEPTAAALVYDHLSSNGPHGNPYVFVYDLGGGTFDATVLEIKGEIKEVLASSGDTALGGDDFDERLRRVLFDRLQEEAGGTLREDDALRVRLLDIAERTKIALSDRPYVRVREVAVAVMNGEPLNLDMEVSREQLEAVTADLIQRTVDKVEEVLVEAGLEADEIGKIILVGGATRMPAVHESLVEIFNQPMEYAMDPDLCVAMGAAIQGGLITGEAVGQILLDVTAHSLGVKTIDTVDSETGEPDHFSIVIRKNTRIPASRAERYRTLRDRQKGVEVEVFQGESESCRANTPVGEFYYPLRPAAAGCPVVVEFAYDREGLVRISVDQKGYDNRKEVTLDIRTRMITEGADTSQESLPVNYIAEKARRLTKDPRLDQALRLRLREISEEYEEAIRNGTAEDRMDALEERLLELMEQAEEKLETSE